MVVGAIGARSLGRHYLGRLVYDRGQRGRPVHGVDTGMGWSVRSVSMVRCFALFSRLSLMFGIIGLLHTNSFWAFQFRTLSCR